MVYESIIDLIGNTPIVKYNNIYLKAEYFNPSGSIKDRPALNILNSLENSKTRKIVEATSGNMGISLAMIGKIKGFEVTIVMPNSMSKERIDLISSYGANIILTDKHIGMRGAVQVAQQLANTGEYIWLNQFANVLNLESHKKTALEIIADMPDVDYIVAGIGTGGTITGIGREIKQHYPDVKIIGVEPAESPVLTKGVAGSHGIQGIGAGFIPEILDKSVIDKIVTIRSSDAIEQTKKMIKEGYSVGISTGAAVLAALEIEKLNPGKKVLTIAPDGGGKYMSVLYV